MAKKQSDLQHTPSVEELAREYRELCRLREDLERYSYPTQCRTQRPLTGGFCLSVVPELTCAADIKLNARVSLRRHCKRVVI
jgi:hypothetical protein